MTHAYEPMHSTPQLPGRGGSSGRRGGRSYRGRGNTAQGNYSGGRGARSQIPVGEETPITMVTASTLVSPPGRKVLLPTPPPQPITTKPRIQVKVGQTQKESDYPGDFVSPPPPTSDSDSATAQSKSDLMVNRSILRFQIQGMDQAIEEVKKQGIGSSNKARLYTYEAATIDLEYAFDGVFRLNKQYKFAIDVNTEDFDIAKWIIKGAEGIGPTHPDTDPRDWNELAHWYDKSDTSCKKIDGNDTVIVNDHRACLVTVGVDDRLQQKLIAYPYIDFHGVTIDATDDILRIECQPTNTAADIEHEMTFEIGTFRSGEIYKARLS